MSTVHTLQEKICREIPILKSMGIEIKNIDLNSSTIQVPLQPNHNHKGTAFGGSLYAACTAACYALIYSRQILSHLEDRDLVIVTGEIKYKKAVNQDFRVQAFLDENNWQSLLTSLKNKKPEKLALKCFVYSQAENVACEFNAQFAFLPSHRRSHE